MHDRMSILWINLSSIIWKKMKPFETTYGFSCKAKCKIHIATIMILASELKVTKAISTPRI